VAQNGDAERRERADGEIPLEMRLSDLRGAPDIALCYVLRYDDQLFEQWYLHRDQLESEPALRARLGEHLSGCLGCEREYKSYHRRAPVEVRHRAKELMDEFIAKEYMPRFREVGQRYEENVQSN